MTGGNIFLHTHNPVPDSNVVYVARVKCTQKYFHPNCKFHSRGGNSGSPVTGPPDRMLGKPNVCLSCDTGRYVIQGDVDRERGWGVLWGLVQDSIARPTVNSLTTGVAPAVEL